MQALFITILSTRQTLHKTLQTLLLLVWKGLQTVLLLPIHPGRQSRSRGPRAGELFALVCLKNFVLFVV
jgi:hypothetical protein